MSGHEALEAFYDALLDDDADKLYDRAPCGYLSTTPEGLIVKANQTFLTLTGYDRADLIGHRTFSDLLTVGGQIFHETHYAPMLQMQGSARAIAVDLVRADGKYLPVLVNSVLERDSFGAAAVIRTAVFDATERRGYERELLRAKQRAEESESLARALARTLQKSLIPPAPPVIAGLDVGAVYRPAGRGEEVGGDFYDIFQVGEGDWVVVVGDVCGKGVEAAVLTALARYTLRGAAVRLPLPSHSLAALNEVLLGDETDRFCTVVFVRLRQDGHGWTAVAGSAGHPLPYVLRRGEVPVVVGQYGSLLGVLPDARFHDARLHLGAGDTLLLYTDGVTEGRRGDEFFGERALEGSILRHAGSAATLAAGVVSDVLDFQDGEPRDDIAVVAIRLSDATSNDDR